MLESKPGTSYERVEGDYIPGLFVQETYAGILNPPLIKRSAKQRAKSKSGAKSIATVKSTFGNPLLEKVEQNSLLENPLLEKVEQNTLLENPPLENQLWETFSEARENPTPLTNFYFYYHI